MTKDEFLIALSAEAVPGSYSLHYRIPDMERGELERRVGAPSKIQVSSSGVCLWYDLEDHLVGVAAGASVGNKLQSPTVVVFKLPK